MVCLIIGLIGGILLLEKVETSNYRLQIANDTEYGIRFAMALEAQLEMSEDHGMILKAIQNSLVSSPSDSSRYLCLLSDSGEVLCHPQGKNLGLNAGGMTIRTEKEEIAFSQWVEQGGQSGLYIVDGNPKELVQRIPIEGVPWNVVVHTNLEVLSRTTSEIKQTIMLILVPMGVLLVITGTAVVRLTGRRYEAMIEESNRLLETRVQERTQALEKALEDLKQTQEALIQNEKMALVGQLMAGIAHEIRSPLAAIQMIAQTMEEDAENEDEGHEARLIISSAERCNRVVRNLLSFARNESPEKSPACLSDVVEEALTLLGPDLKDSKVTLLKELDKERFTVQVDSVQIQQVVINLVRNAIEALLESTQPEDRRIRVSTRVVEGSFHLEIEDSGDGVPPEVQETLFEPFHTTKGQTGTGLGLSLCRRFIERHQGEISYRKSESLGGACFDIVLPENTSNETVYKEISEPLTPTRPN